MWEYNYSRSPELYHHGIKGQKWGIRRYQNEDGSLTKEGASRYTKGSAACSSVLNKNKKISVFDLYRNSKARYDYTQAKIKAETSGRRKSVCHSGIFGQKWGNRRYQNPDGTYTELGKLRKRESNKNYSKDYIESRKRKDIKTATTEELERDARRFNAERNYSEAKRKNNALLKTAVGVTAVVAAGAAIFGALGGFEKSLDTAIKAFPGFKSNVGLIWDTIRRSFPTQVKWLY